MRKIIDRNDYDWEIDEFLKQLLNVNTLPRFIIIETVEEKE